MGLLGVAIVTGSTMVVLSAQNRDADNRSVDVGSTPIQ